MDIAMVSWHSNCFLVKNMRQNVDFKDFCFHLLVRWTQKLDETFQYVCDGKIVRTNVTPARRDPSSNYRASSFGLNWWLAGTLHQSVKI
jgi:hypothetical protein